MKYTLNTFCEKVEVDIPDGTTEVAGIVVSGDEILVYPVYRDPAWEDRCQDFLDGAFHRILIDGKWVDKEEE